MKLKGWKEVTPGAVCTEAGSALKFKTAHGGLQGLNG